MTYTATQVMSVYEHTHTHAHTHTHTHKHTHTQTHIHTNTHLHVYMHKDQKVCPITLLLPTSDNIPTNQIDRAIHCSPGNGRPLLANHQGDHVTFPVLL